MSRAELIFWVVIGLGGICASALFSGLEIGLYRLNRIRLHLLAQQGSSSAQRLAGLLKNRAAMLATLLIANNVANNLSSSATSIVLESGTLTSWQVIAISCLLITPVLFVVGETLPKDLFAAHADRLVYPFSRFLWFLRWFFTFTGVLPLVLLVSDLPMRLFGGKRNHVRFHPRHEMHMLVREGVGYGLLSDEQSAMVQRVLDLGNHKVSHEMIPWKQVIKIQSSKNTDQLWKLAEETSVSRFPVLDAAGKVLGVVSLYEVLRYTREECPPLAQLIKPGIAINASTPVREALLMLRSSHDTLGIVMEKNRPVGIVTVKDLVEPITGELASW